MSITHRLLESGLTNKDSEDLGSLAMGVRREIVREGFCTSEKCTVYFKIVGKDKNGEDKLHTQYKPKVLKTKNTDKSKCPDCGRFLKWETRKL